MRRDPPAGTRPRPTTMPAEFPPRLKSGGVGSDNGRRNARGPSMNARTRAGRGSIAALAALSTLVVAAGLVGLMYWRPGEPSDAGLTGEPLLVYCAAGIKAPVEAAAREYEKAYGVPVQLQYGGSQTLLANLQVAARGDLYIPGDDDYIRVARKKDVIDEVIPLAKMTPVLIVKKSNADRLKTLDDLFAAGVKVSQADPERAAAGRLTREALTRLGKWEKLAARTIVYKPTVHDVAADVQIGAADAGIVWDALAGQYGELAFIPLREFEGLSARVSAAVLRCTTQPTAALRFARYLGARDRGLVHFEKNKFVPEDGDVWAERPKLEVFSGAMLQAAVDDTIKRFEQREGVEVVRVYNGCGLLVAQMEAGARPDVYFACDRSFMVQVKRLFGPPMDVSENELVILVPKGNPHGVKSLADLAKPGLRVGLGHEQKCALGAITAETLRTVRLAEKVSRNVLVQSATGDDLVNKLRVKSLDAVVAYVSNAIHCENELDAIRIEGIPCSIAYQPIATGAGSVQKQTAGRLVAALTAAESKRRFLDNGFRWSLPEKK
jgi:molybdenum ABC transporter molybdate-binding protein